MLATADIKTAPAAIIIGCITRHLASHSNVDEAPILTHDNLISKIAVDTLHEPESANKIVELACAQLAAEIGNCADNEVPLIIHNKIRDQFSRRSGRDPLIAKYKSANLYSHEAVDDIVKYYEAAQQLADTAPEQDGDAPDIPEQPLPNKPIDLARIDVYKMNGLSTAIDHATDGQLNGRDIIGRLAAAEEAAQSMHAVANYYKQQAERGYGSGDVRTEMPDLATIWRPTLTRLDKVFPLSNLTAAEPTILANLAQIDVQVFAAEPPHPYVPAIDPDYVFNAEDLVTAIYAIENNANFILVGPTGCGKTCFTEQLAARLGRPFFRIPIDGEMRRRDLLGGFKQVTTERGSKTEWFDGILTRALRMPSLIDLDEFDRSDPNLVYSAHQALEHNGIIITEDEGRKVMPHPKCAIAGTANTKGRADAMGLYAMISELSEASRDRFPFWIDVDYLPQADEQKMLLKINKNYDNDQAATLTKIAEGIRISFKAGTLRTTCSTRQIKEIMAYAHFLVRIMGKKLAFKTAITKILIGRAPDDHDTNALTQLINTYDPDLLA